MRSPAFFLVRHQLACAVADLEWKLTYVGSAESEKYDQVLDSVLVGPVAAGQFRFVFQVSSAAACFAASLARLAQALPRNGPPGKLMLVAACSAVLQAKSGQRPVGCSPGYVSTTVACSFLEPSNSLQRGTSEMKCASPHELDMQADAPDASKLPTADIVGVTVLLLTCSYKEQVRLGVCLGMVVSA